MENSMKKEWASCMYRMITDKMRHVIMKEDWKKLLCVMEYVTGNYFSILSYLPIFLWHDFAFYQMKQRCFKTNQVEQGH